MLLFLQDLTRWLHIFAGFTALTVGIVPMIARKGSNLHIRTGQVYAWAMFIVGISAVLTYFIKPHSWGRFFLMFIGIFSFYLTYSGIRAINQKKTGFSASYFDWTAAGLMLFSGAVMLTTSVWWIWQFFLGNAADVTLGILFAVFGMFCVMLGRKDLSDFRSQTVESQKMHWFYKHLTRMVGAYIATVTAFCVVNGDKLGLPSLVVWLLPGAIGGFGISRWVRYYRKKFATSLPKSAVFPL